MHCAFMKGRVQKTHSNKWFPVEERNEFNYFFHKQMILKSLVVEDYDLKDTT